MAGRALVKRAKPRAGGKMQDVKAELKRAAKKNSTERYVLRLFVTGSSPRSTRAIENIRRLCESHLKGRYDLEVVDVYQQPVLAVDAQIVAAPTLIKKLPLPLRRIIGDLSNEAHVMMGLDLKPRSLASASE